MSRTIFTIDELLVTRCAGPASEGSDRARWEVLVTERAGGAAVVRLRRDQALALAHELIRDAAPVAAEVEL